MTAARSSSIRPRTLRACSGWRSRWTRSPLEMRAAQSMDNPGWRGRVNEYSQLAGECMLVRRSSPLTKEAVLDVVFSVRPVFSGPIPDGLEAIGPLQDEMLAAAEELRKGS